MAARLELTSGQQELVRWVAICTMVVDHVGAVLLEPAVALPLRAVGRVAWPLFAFLLAYNVARRGVDPVRYLRPLATWYVVSIVPYYLAFGLWRPNILATLLLAALGLAVLQRGSAPGSRWAGGAPVVVALLVAAGLFVEYGARGVLLPIVAWWALSTNRPVAWGATLLLVAAQNFPWEVWPAALASLLVPLAASVLPVRVPRSGKFAWVFYPAHLLVLGLIQRAA